MNGKFTYIETYNYDKPAGKLLLNKDTNEIALMSSLNSVAISHYKYRLINSLHNDYKICNCKMIAPLIFWA